MYYRCPYCDSALHVRKKNCPNCGASSSAFVTIYEPSDHEDKVRDTTGKLPVDRARQLLLFILSVIGCVVPGYGIFINLVVAILCIVKKKLFRVGMGRAACYVSCIRLLLTFILYAVVIFIVIMMDGRLPDGIL